MVKRESLEQSLKELLRKKGIRVSKIILLGSYAKSKEKEESDIDIIIVSEDFKGKDIFERVRIARGLHSGLVKEFMRPFDLMYYSNEEWKAGKSLIIDQAKKYGEVIYG